MRGTAVLFALLVVTLIATGVAAVARPGGPDVTGEPDFSITSPDTLGVSFDTSALFSNRTGGPITLLSVAVIPVAGWDTPLLVHIGVIRGPGEIGSALGWPPSPFSPGRFQDATVGPGVVDVAVGLSAAQPGVYGMNGIRIAYLDGARVGHVSAGPSELVCVHRAPNGPACPDEVSQRFQDALPGP